MAIAAILDRDEAKKLADTNFIVSSDQGPYDRLLAIRFAPIHNALCSVGDRHSERGETDFCISYTSRKERPTLARLPIACAVVSAGVSGHLTAEGVIQLIVHSDTYWDPDSGRLCAHSDRNRRSSDSVVGVLISDLAILILQMLSPRMF